MTVEICVRVEPLDDSELPRRAKLEILRGQLTLIRERVERGIPVPASAIRAAEKMARSLEGLEIVA